MTAAEVLPLRRPRTESCRRFRIWSTRSRASAPIESTAGSARLSTASTRNCQDASDAAARLFRGKRFGTIRRPSRVQSKKMAFEATELLATSRALSDRSTRVPQSGGREPRSRGAHRGARTWNGSARNILEAAPNARRFHRGSRSACRATRET